MSDDLASLAGLREMVGLTQTQLAERLGRKQPEVSRLEWRALSRQRIGQVARYVEALGGKLEVVIKLDGQEYVVEPFGRREDAW